MKQAGTMVIKNLRYLCLVGVIAIGLMTIVATGGGTGGNVGGNGGATNTITIKGNILNGSHAKNLWYDRLLDKIHSPAYALDPNEVAKVMVFYQDGSYKFSKVTEDGNFSITVDKSAPAGMIFVGAGDNFLGYLTLGDGIDTLPLNSIADDVSEIDLGILSSSGLIVEPSHNPLSNEIPLTPEEQKALAQCDDLFSSIVKNPDVDGNGIIDFLEGKFFRLQILYYVSAGSFDGDLGLTVNEPTDISGYKLAFDLTGTNLPQTVDFTGPAGSGLSSSTSAGSNVYTGRTTYFSPYVGSIPPAGQYTVDYDTNTLTFTLPDQSAAPSNIVLPVPTVTLNDDRSIQKVNWVYRLGSAATAALDPLTIISKIELQIDGSGSPCASYPQAGRMYNSGWLSATTTGHFLTCQTLSWDDITRIYMAYEDLYENHYVVIYSKGDSVNKTCTQDSDGGQCVTYVRNYFGGSYQSMPGLCQYSDDCGAYNAWGHWDLGFGSGPTPAANSIMVIDQTAGLSTGHVAVVIDVSSNSDGTYNLTIQESNWDLDELVDCDVTYTFYPDDSEVTREGGSTRYPILGFIYGT